MKTYKGTLKKTERGWEVYHQAKRPYSQITNPLPIHHSFVAKLETCFTTSISHEVDFEIVDEYSHPELYDGVPLWQGEFYAKVIKC